VRIETLRLLRCPFCGWRVELTASLFHRIDGGEIRDAALECRCSEYVVVDGIAVMAVWPEAEAARAHIGKGRTADALRAMLNFEDGAPAAALVGDDGEPLGSYQEIAEGIGEQFEGGYFVYRVSDPTFLVAQAVVRAIAASMPEDAAPALDLCGGSGHLTRVLASAGRRPPVLADLSFIKLWLAHHFTAPGADAVLADGEHPLPFASGSFGFVVGNDAFHYIWNKAQLAREMWRVADARATVAITHTHNADAATPSRGMPLRADHYRALFDRADARVFGEGAALDDAVAGRVDLSRREPDGSLAHEEAFFVVAPRDPDIFRVHSLRAPARVEGHLAFSPLYDVERHDSCATLTLRFPSRDYEDEYRASRSYLPETMAVDHGLLAAIDRGELTDAVRELMARRVVVDLPVNYLKCSR
jgi:hypothetical protein